jgi:ATP:corrinoid adenosyltransferase
MMNRGHTPAEIIEMADMVTECQAKKHYYDQGTTSRVGIEK